MNVAEFLRGLVRRPIVCAIVAVLAVLAAAAGWLSAKTEYQTTAAAVVIPPGSGSPDAGLNPLINLNNDMAQLAVVISSAMQSQPARQAVEDAGAASDYTISTTAGDVSSFAQLSAQIVMTTHGPDAESSKNGAQALIDFARDRLVAVQRDAAVPPRNNALLVVSTEPEPGSAVSTSPLRTAVSYAAVAVVLAVVVLIVEEAIREQLRRRRPNSTEEPEETEKSEASDEPDAATDDSHDTTENDFAWLPKSSAPSTAQHPDSN